MIWLALAVVVAIVASSAASSTPSSTPAAHDWHGFTLAWLSRTSTGIANDPPADVLPALSDTAFRLRLLLDEWPAVRVTSVYRCRAVTAAIWTSANPQPTWDWHEKGHAADIAGVDFEALFAWSQNNGWVGADSMIESNHVHLAWS